jgi:hypothetical protein
MRALSVLSLKKNSLGKENDRGGMQALSDMLKGNTVLTDLDMSENHMDATDAKIFSEGISDNEAMTKLDLSSNDIGGRDKEEQQKDLEVLLQSYGTSIEALEEHFEEPADESTFAIINMVRCMYVRPIYQCIFVLTVVLVAGCCCHEKGKRRVLRQYYGKDVSMLSACRC